MKTTRMKEKFIEALPKDKNICLLGLQGSRMLGLAQSNDADYDYRGIFIEENDRLLSLNKPKETLEFGTNKDGEAEFVLHEVEKFFRLALKGNPSIIHLFFVPKYNIQTDVGREIVKNANLFLSEPYIRSAFGGYALSQILYLKRSQSNTIRKEKHARHCFRLFDEGKELLKTGKITVPLKNPKYYLEIGKKINEPGGIEYLTELFKEKDLEFKETKSILPKKPDIFLANKLLLKIRGF